MLKNHFPMRVAVTDVDGIVRNVSNLHDLVELAREKADKHADEESQRFVADADAYFASKPAAKAPKKVAEEDGEDDEDLDDQEDDTEEQEKPPVKTKTPPVKTQPKTQTKKK